MRKDKDTVRHLKGGPNHASYCVCARGRAGMQALSMFVCLTNDRLSGWIGAMAAVMENTVVVIAVGLRQ